MIEIKGNNSDKVKRNCLGIFIIIIIGLVLFLCYYFNKISDYKKVEANIVSISTNYHSGTGKTKSSKAYYITYEFTYNGNQYQVTQQALTKIGKSEGDVVTIRCNPDNPQEIANMNYVKGSIVAIIILLLFSYVIIRQMKIENHDQNTNSGVV
jgi:flagellar biogenesis protein FliO